MDQTVTRLRAATAEDMQLLFDWVNDEEVRKNAIHTSAISWDTHCSWLTSQLEKTDSTIYILESANTPIGQIRLDQKDNSVTITYSIAKEHRGKGWGKRIIEEALKISIGRSFRAIVRTENTASAKIFRSLGFREMPDPDNPEKFLIFVTD